MKYIWDCKKVNKRNYYLPLLEGKTDSIIRKSVPEEMRHYLSTNSIKEVVNWLWTLLEESIDNTRNPDIMNYLNFKNGVLDVKNNCQYLGNPDLGFGQYLNVEYPFNYYSSGSYFDNFISSCFQGNEELIRVYQEILGFSISNLFDLKCSIFLYGATNSGKGVTCDLLKAMHGEIFTSSVNFAQMSGRFMTAQLFNKYLNIGSEIDETNSNRLDVFKRLTGNDVITAESKGTHPFQFINKAHLIFACNNLPKLIGNDSESLFSRMKVFPFSRSFKRSEWITGLKDKLINELPYIAQFAVMGLKRFIENGYQFSYCREIKLIEKRYRTEQNSFLSFCDDYLVKDIHLKLSTEEIQEQYIKYCEDLGIVPVNYKYWPDILYKKYGAEKIREIDTPYGANRRGFKGIS